MESEAMIKKLIDGLTPVNKRFTNPIGADFYAGIKEAASGEDINKSKNFFYKALESGTATSGAEMIPESWAAKAIYQLYEANWARQLFQTRVIPFGMKMNIPKFSTKLVEASGVSDATDALGTELTSTTAIEKATMTTTEVELELKTLALRLEVQNKWYAYNVDPNAESELRAEFVNKIKEVEEDMIINGDVETTSASNIMYTYNDSTNKTGVNTATGDNEHLLLFDGMRNSATGTAVDNGSVAADSSDFREMQLNMGIFARKGKEQLAFIVSPDLYYTMLGFTEIITVDKYGPNASIVTGELAKIFGIRVIVTNKMPCTERASLTNNAGIRAASGNDYTEGMLVYIDTVIIGAPAKAERMFNIKKKEWPEYDRQDLIAVEDFGFTFKYTEAMVRLYDCT